MPKIKGMYGCSRCNRRFDNEASTQSHINDRHFGVGFLTCTRPKPKKRSRLQFETEPFNPRSFDMEDADGYDT